jgi:hypothetical protein
MTSDMAADLLADSVAGDASRLHLGTWKYLDRNRFMELAFRVRIR